jgi:ADP-ribose pyrophosphatase YjhB (NUDIX family)
MIKKTIRSIWRAIPPRTRLKIVRTTQRKFTASVAAVVVNDSNEVLLLDHVLRPFATWGLPGGFLGRGEQPEAALERELREEVGIKITGIKLYCVRNHDRHIEILFIARSNETPQIRSREIINCGWFSVGNLPEPISLTQKRLIEEILRGKVDKRDLSA